MSRPTTTTMPWLSLLLPVCLLLLPSPSSSTSIPADPSAAYALYSLPPFTLTFTSSYNTQGLPTDSEERSSLLTTALQSPLQLITAEFLMESFRIQISRTKPESSFTLGGLNNEETQPTQEEELHAILDSFMTLDLQVAVRTSDHLSLTSGHHDGRGLVQDISLPSTTTARATNVELLQFEADFFTTAAFLEPSLSVKPSNQEVASILGGWIQTSFETDQEIYKQDLVNSEIGVLEHLQDLHIQTDSGAVFDPYTTGVASGGKEESAFDPPPNAAAKTTQSTIGAWSNAEKLFFTMLVCVSIISIAGLLYALKRFKGRNKELTRMMESDFSHREPFSDTLGGRHSDEIMDILNASDRYLAEHRPDLLEAMQQTTSPRRDSSGLVIPIASPQQQQNRPVERRYVTATNPFSYLYGASYFHSEKTAVEQDRRRNRPSDPMNAVELQPESVPDDEDLDLVADDQAVSGFLQTWFQQLVGKRSTTSPVQGMEEEADGLTLVQDEMNDLVMEECANQDGMPMACEEDPADYNFAYQDFPRQDGTPCLIYEETLDEEEEEQYLRNSSSRASLHSTTSFGVDDEFQRQLSQHNLYDTSPGRSTSFEQRDVEVEDVDTTEEEESVTADYSDDDPSKFTDKLERLVAVRHRHYEKQQIVEKHREQRRQERAKQRADQQKKEMQHRDFKLRRHSLELDIQELEAAASSISTPTSIISPTDSNQSQTSKKPVIKPKLHRRTSSEADVGLSTILATAIPSNRSMDLEEGSALNPTSSDPRLIQSARKPTRPPTKTKDVFRSIEKTSPGSTSSMTLPPFPLQQSVPMVSPNSSMTDTGSAPSSAGSIRSTPPMGSGSIRDGTSARKKKRTTISSASAALAKGFQHRRSMSFGGVEEKKVDDENMVNGAESRRLPPMRTSSNRHRRSNSSSPADVMVHGIYAQWQ